METKWVAIAISVVFISVGAAETMKRYLDGQVKIACYEAAKNNKDIRCEK